MARVALERVTKDYPSGTRAVADLSIEVADGEFVVVVGPSGCGKTTVLRLIAGLEELTSGEVRIGERAVTHVAPRDRDVAMVFQHDALFPHLTVADNVGFGLRLRRLPRAEIAQRVTEIAGVLGLDDVLDRRPRELSGGQRQRAAMGRALVRSPQAFLMDEPLSNLDAKLRVQLRAEIARIQRTLRVTTLYVTHDQVEAMTMGDRVAVLRRGVLQQLDTPQALYEHPVNAFVAGFIGSPAMNLIGAVLEVGDDVHARVGDTRLALGPRVLAARPVLRAMDGRRIIIGIRPDDLTPSGNEGSTSDLQVVVERSELLGAEVHLHATLATPQVLTDDVRDLAADGGDDALAELEAAASRGTTSLVARCRPDLRVQPGERLALTVDGDRLHVFDPVSGVAISSTA